MLELGSEEFADPVSQSENQTIHPSAKTYDHVSNEPNVLRSDHSEAVDEALNESPIECAPKHDAVGSSPTNHASSTKIPLQNYHQPQSIQIGQADIETSDAVGASHGSLLRVKIDGRPQLTLKIPGGVDVDVASATTRDGFRVDSQSSANDGNAAKLCPSITRLSKKTSQQAPSPSEPQLSVEVDDDETSEGTPWTVAVEAYATALGQSSLSSTHTDFGLARAMQREIDFDAQLFLPKFHRSTAILTQPRPKGRPWQRSRTSQRKRKREEIS